MDPYVKVKYDGKKHKTQVHSGGGKNPSWNDTLSFKASDCSLIHISVWDEDTASSNDMVGEAQIDLKAIMTQKAFADWIKLTYKGKEAGELW